MTTTVRSGVIWLWSPDPDPKTLRFTVLVDGYMEQWTLDKIKQEVAGGATLRERGK